MRIAYVFTVGYLMPCVEEIAIRFCFSDFSSLPSLLFSCQTLVMLKLDVIFKLNVPSEICLPKLKILDLSSSKFENGSSVLGLISSCPVLEDLESSHCHFSKISVLDIHSLSLRRLHLDVIEFRRDPEYERSFNSIKITAPNFVWFKYVERMVENCILSEMQSLKSAEIQITLLDDKCQEHAVKLLQQINNVRSLFLSVNQSFSQRVSVQYRRSTHVL
ncbi:hypothetical protein V6N13_041560 [Hibiscus sabdariffa]|uniref:F-box/LRR-repeat protein 15/At3g58940/PEG3-like LRR domain-containing protein n=1 Tax=Hibiscus sabdariffa TaxID=183260 RepID=A0ABR2RCE6_9ROSI